VSPSPLKAERRWSDGPDEERRLDSDLLDINDAAVVGKALNTIDLDLVFLAEPALEFAADGSENAW
jgi:hypothetical protein